MAVIDKHEYIRIFKRIEDKVRDLQLNFYK